MKAIFAVSIFASLALFADEAEVAQEVQNPVKKVIQQQDEAQVEGEVAQQEVCVEEQA